MNLTSVSNSATISMYRIDGECPVARYIVSTPESRAISNDPFVIGVDYTNKLQVAVRNVFEQLRMNDATDERAAVVLHILRGGLNFGIRQALHDAYGWNRHNSAFISSQRAQDKNGVWYITENRYQKVYIPDAAHIIFGDVVATGASLEHALLRIVEIATEQKKTISRITFFTIGGNRAEEILARVDAECRKQFPQFAGSQVIYFEGVFGVPAAGSTLHIALPGTDLLRSPAALAPEFIASQAEQPSYAIERCAIYDAGSRAFYAEEYLEDVLDYWEKVKKLAEEGMTYGAFLRERFPEDARLENADWVAQQDAKILHDIAEAQCAKARA